MRNENHRCIKSFLAINKLFILFKYRFDALLFALAKCSKFLRYHLNAIYTFLFKTLMHFKHSSSNTFTTCNDSSKQVKLIVIILSVKYSKVEYLSKYRTRS